MTAAVGFLTIMLILVIGITTKKGLAYLMWPVILAYPHRLTLGVLPLNAGFDDVYVLAALLCLLIRGVKLRFGWVVGMACAMLGIVILGELTSILLVGGSSFAVSGALKTILKMTVRVALVVVVYSAMEDEKDYSRMLVSYAIGMFLACFIAMADWKDMDWAQWFFVIMTEEEALTRYRAAGSFLTPDGLGINVAIALIIIGQFIVYRSKRTTKIAALLFCVLFLGALIGSGSRTGALSVVVTVLVMIMFWKRRVPVLACFVLAMIVFLSLPTYRAAVYDMLERTTSQSQVEGGILVGSGRLNNMISCFKTDGGPWTLFCGSGLTHFSLRGGYAHNAVVSTLIVRGLFGLVWYVAFFRRIFKQSFFLKRHAPSGVAHNFSVGVLWALMATFVASLTSDPPLNPFWQIGILWIGAMQAAMMRRYYGQENPALVLTHYAAANQRLMAQSAGRPGLGRQQTGRGPAQSTADPYSGY